MDMAEEQNKFKRVEPDDPHRCTGIAKGTGNQCIFESVKLPDGSYGNKCSLHDGWGHQIKGVKKEAIRLYELTKYRGKIDRLAQAGEQAYLDEELATLRMTLENCLNKYSDIELITFSGQISSLVRDIRDTLTANKKLKSQMGALLDKSAIDRLCTAIVAVVAKEVPPERIDAVCSGIAQAVATAIASRIDGL